MLTYADSLVLAPIFSLWRMLTWQKKAIRGLVEVMEEQVRQV